jgi:diaminopimelate epimerase
MSIISFSKYHSAGNDFILIDDRALFFDSSLVPSLCRRQFGIGADGVILLQPTTKADFRMRIFNADGSEAASCGNGLCCLTRFIFDLGGQKENYLIATQDQMVEVHIQEGVVSLRLNPKSQSDFRGPLMECKAAIQNPKSRSDFRGPLMKCKAALHLGEVYFVDTGVPHVVVFVPNVAQVDVAEEGALIRWHPDFEPEGTNVNFAQVNEDGSITCRTFERGLEKESLACGTGAAAVAFIASHIYQMAASIPIHFPGGMIEVEVSDSIIIKSRPVKVFEGIYINS